MKTPSGSRSDPASARGDDADTDADEHGGDDPALRAMRQVWLEMRDQEPPDGGMVDLLAAARAKASTMQPRPAWWRRMLASLRRPPALAFATVIVLIGGAVLLTRRIDSAAPEQTFGQASTADDRARETRPDGVQPALERAAEADPKQKEANADRSRTTTTSIGGDGSEEPAASAGSAAKLSAVAGKAASAPANRGPSDRPAESPAAGSPAAGSPTAGSPTAGSPVMGSPVTGSSGARDAEASSGAERGNNGVDVPRMPTSHRPTPPERTATKSGGERREGAAPSALPLKKGEPPPAPPHGSPPPTLHAKKTEPPPPPAGSAPSTLQTREPPPPPSPPSASVAEQAGRGADLDGASSSDDALAAPDGKGAGAPAVAERKNDKRAVRAAAGSTLATLYRQCAVAAERGDCAAVRRLVGQITPRDRGYRARISKDSAVGKCLADVAN